MKRRSFISLASIPLGLALSHVQAGTTEAKEISLGVFPTITEITAGSGETLETSITVKNNEGNSVALTTLLQPFTASGNEDGQVRYYDEAPDIFRSVQVFDERQRVNEITLSPNEEKTLTLRISIPERPEPRDYYFSLVLLVKPETPEVGVDQGGIQASSAVSGGVAAHFMISVNASTKAKLSLTEFSTPALSRSSPIPFTIRVANEGTNLSIVDGEVTVKNFLGIPAETIKLPATRILSHSTRTLTQAPTDEITGDPATRIATVLERAPLFPGIYRAELKLSDTTSSTVLSKSIFFAVAPIELLVGCVIFIVIALLVRRKLLNERN